MTKKYVLLDISEHQEVLNSMSLTLRTPTQTMKIYDDANINISTFHEFAFKCIKIWSGRKCALDSK